MLTVEAPQPATLTCTCQLVTDKVGLPVIRRDAECPTHVLDRPRYHFTWWHHPMVTYYR